MAKFTVCIVNPPGYVHSMCFWDVAVLVNASLETLGHSSSICFNRLSEDCTNIVLGYHLIEYGDALKRYRYIPYQLEQLGAEDGRCSDNVMRVLETAADVWDTSLDNVDFLNRFGIRAKLLPIGFHEKLSRVQHAVVKDIDVLFYGSMSDRRRTVLEGLAAVPGLNVSYFGGLYGSQRDATIARAKIVLNIHFFPAQILEVVRVSYLLNNACLVLTEQSGSNPYDGVPLSTSRHEELVDEARRLLSSPDTMEELRTSGYSTFKDRYSMPQLLRSVL